MYLIYFYGKRQSYYFTIREKNHDEVFLNKILVMIGCLLAVSFMPGIRNQNFWNLLRQIKLAKKKGESC